MAGSRRRTRNTRTSKVRVGVRKVAASQSRRAPLPVELKFAAAAAAAAGAQPSSAPHLMAGGKLTAPAWNVSAPPSRNYAAAGLAVNPNKRTGRNAPTGGLALEVRERGEKRERLRAAPHPSQKRHTHFSHHLSLTLHSRQAKAAAIAAGTLVHDSDEDDDDLRSAEGKPRADGAKRGAHAALTSTQARVIAALTAAHGRDVAAMARDTKRNRMLLPPSKLRVLVEAWEAAGGAAEGGVRCRFSAPIKSLGRKF